ncbi:MAG: hypothetical protein KIT75_03440 [Planctomycetota bacterium]|nr:hypothetical protein [Planctomycetota bacterium]
MTQQNPWQYDPNAAKPHWAEGFYKGQIFKVEVQARKTGADDMLAVTFKAWNGKQNQLITDYFTREQVGLARYQRLAKALGAADDFKAGKFYAGDYLESPLVLFLKVEESQEYGVSNKVGGYEPASWQPTADHTTRGYAFPDFQRPGRPAQAQDFQNLPATR